MYNRYIPQPDGSFRRNRVPEPQRPQRPAPPCPPPPPEPCPEPPKTCAAPPRRPCHHRHPQQKNEPVHTSAAGFLKNLLPKDFDTGDLLVVLLLLLMAGDNSENQSSAMLTLALYLFM